MTKKKYKKNIKIIEYKTKVERLKEVLEVRNQMLSVGLSVGHEAVNMFHNILSEYVKTGEYWEGKLKITGFERTLIINLYNRKHVKISVIFKYTPGI